MEEEVAADGPEVVEVVTEEADMAVEDGLEVVEEVDGPEEAVEEVGGQEEEAAVAADGEETATLFSQLRVDNRLSFPNSVLPSLFSCSACAGLRVDSFNFKNIVVHIAIIPIICHYNIDERMKRPVSDQRRKHPESMQNKHDLFRVTKS